MSAYAKLPDAPQPKDRSGAARELRASAERVATAVSSTVSGAVSSAVSSTGRGLSRASRELEAPEGSDVAALIAEANLPEIDADDALAALSRRLDREADLWRNLAIRELAHVAWANRIAHLASALTIVGVLGLAALAAFESLLGSASGGRALLLVVGAVVLATGAVVATAASASVRRSQREVVRDALVRADLAELRLHRVAIAIAAAKSDPAHAREAIARLERDVAG